MKLTRKIALLILAGLIMGLFGSYMLAMDPVIIQDASGAQFEPNAVQRNALRQCQTFEPFLARENIDNLDKRHAIDLGVISRSFVSVENIRDLAQIINDKRHIATITEAKKIVELFRLADYMQAPREVVQFLAPLAEEKINTKMPKAELAGMLSCKDFDSMETTLRGIRHLLKEYHWNIDDLLEANRPGGRRFVAQTTEECLDLDWDNNGNRLRSLKGIKNCVEFPDRIRSMYLNNQNLKEIDIGYLRKLFPNLNALFLKNNAIEKISETEVLRKLGVDLTGNPLKSIAIKKPERCNYLLFQTDKPGVQANFVQNRYSKMQTWFKSLVAKSKLVRKSLLPTAPSIFIVSGLCACAGGLACMAAEKAARQDDENVLANLVLANSQKILVLGNLLKNLQGYPLAEIVEKYGPDARIVTLREVAHLLPPVEIRSYKEAFLIGVVGGGILGSLAITGLSILGGLIDMVSWGGNEFEKKTEYNPYRIRVQSGNAIVKDFSSNYTYNLFGKM